jgi:hypothetical protein
MVSDENLQRGAIVPLGFVVARIGRPAVGCMSVTVEEIVTECVNTVTFSLTGLNDFGILEALQRAVDTAVEALRASTIASAFFYAARDAMSAELESELRMRLHSDGKGDAEARRRVERRILDAMKVALAFVSELNLQDHPIAVQRQQREIVRVLMEACAKHPEGCWQPAESGPQSADTNGH